MGLYDRDYTQADSKSQGSGFHFSPQFSLPTLTPVVKWLLIVNIGIFLVAVLIPPVQHHVYQWFQLDARSVGQALQVWRLVTYQFLHDPNFVWHIFFNMLGLFFLGPTLERHWGTKRFLPFYLGCGVAGALLYYFLVAVRILPAGEMVGASGAILGMLAACAILFPHFVVFVFIFPVPIRIAAVAFTAVFLVTILTGGGKCRRRRGSPGGDGGGGPLCVLATVA